MQWPRETRAIASRRRGDCVRNLSIEDSKLVGTMPPVVTATALGSQSGSLEMLHLKAESVGFTGVEIAALAALTRLQCLEVWTYSMSAALTPDRCLPGEVSALY